MIELGVEGIAADVGEWEATGDGRWILEVNAGMFLYEGDEVPEDEIFSATLEFSEKCWTATVEHTNRGNPDEYHLDTADLELAKVQAERVLLKFMRDWRTTATEDGGEPYK